MDAEATIHFSELVPRKPAPLSPSYRQFLRTEIPLGSSATHAFCGTIQPFNSDDDARSFLRDMEAGRNSWVSEGNIRAGESKGQHWADPLLVGMRVKCDILIVIPSAPAHPRSYLLSPRFHRHYCIPDIHPHPHGDDWEIFHGGGYVPGLCLYSAAEFRYDRSGDVFQQFLDQVTLYVGCHLIWLRTRRQCRKIGPETIVLHQPKPGEKIVVDSPQRSIILINGRQRAVLDFWTGYWPGRSARATTPAQHVKQIPRNAECWCCSGLRYDHCHFVRELAVADASTLLSQNTG
jgi:SEC-C motif